jgi:sugar transferase (PEP-CTERM/EpsH1 system associated)
LADPVADHKPPLLYLTHRLPYPPNKGDKVRSHHILRHLANEHRVFLGTFTDAPEDRKHVPALSEWCADVCAVPIRPGPQRLASLRGLLAGEALSLPYYRSRRLMGWTDAVVSRHGITRAVAFSGPMAQYLDDPRLQRRVVDFCDVDSAKWTQYAATRAWPLSWLYRREGQSLLAFERKAAMDSDASLFVTPAEAAIFRNAAPEAAAKIGIMQNGVDTGFFSPANAPTSPYPAGTPTVTFTGAMDYWPNIDAVRWFATELLPQMRRVHPGLQFWIVGMNPTGAVRALAGDGVVVTGTVPDVRPYLAHATVVVAPLRIARGVQNKVLEAMAMARPVVVSAASAAGLDAGQEQAYESADSGDDFIRTVLRLLDNAEVAAEMGQAARRFVVSRCSWGAALRVMEYALTQDPFAPSATTKSPSARD